MTTFGKIVGGGMPMAVYSGRRDYGLCITDRASLSGGTLFRQSGGSGSGNCDAEAFDGRYRCL